MTKRGWQLFYVSYISLLWVTGTLSTSTLSIRANFEQLLSLMSVEALKWNVCNFLPSWGICIRLSVLQSSHRLEPCFRAKSQLKVQSSIELCDRSKISFAYHLLYMLSYLYDYLWWNLPLVSVFMHLIDIVLNSPLSTFLKELTVTLKRGVFVRLMNQRCIQQPNRCYSPPVSREMQCPARDIWHPDVCHYSSWKGFQ